MKNIIKNMILAVVLIGSFVPVVFSESRVLEVGLLSEDKITNAEAVSKTLEFAIKEHVRYLEYLEQEITSVENLIKKTQSDKLLSKFKDATQSLKNVVKLTKQEIATKKMTIENNFRIIEEERELIALRKTPYFEKPDHAFFDITLKELTDNLDFYSTKNVAISGWIRKQEEIKDSRYAFFSFGLNDDPEITLIFDVTKTRFTSNIIDQPFYIMGEFVKELSIETDFKTVEVKSALLVSFISKNWEMLK